MPAPRALVALAVLSSLSGCGASLNPLSWFGGGQPAGVASGLVTYGGEPAAYRKVVAVLSGDTAPIATATTDVNGRYTLRGLAGKTVQVLYKGAGDQFQDKTPGNEDDPRRVLPNELDTWRSEPQDLAGGGKTVPPFDVAYNGLLYPDITVALVVSDKALVPFHWSVHPQAQSYRVRVQSQDNTTVNWTSRWDSQPTAVFGMKVDPGRYHWLVEIDGGSAGAGATRPRNVDF